MKPPKIKSIISIFLLLMLVWGNYSILRFSHYHVDESGQILLHTHPFHEENRQSPTPVKHTHSKHEFSILSFIFEVLSIFIFCFFILFLALKFNPVYKTVLLQQFNLVSLILRDISRRGPPVCPID